MRLTRLRVPIADHGRQYVENGGQVALDRLELTAAAIDFILEVPVTHERQERGGQRSRQQRNQHAERDQRAGRESHSIVRPPGRNHERHPPMSSAAPGMPAVRTAAPRTLASESRAATRCPQILNS